MRGLRGPVDYLRPMAETMRSCSRTGCRWPAAASLSFRYASREVWLLDLAEPHPSLYDMCPHHADSLVVPQGWATVDERTVREVMREPSAAEIADRAARERLGSRGAHGPAAPVIEAPVNRYADLARELPRIAKELAGVGAVIAGPAPQDPAGPTEPSAHAPPQHSPSSQAMFSRDLAPVPPHAEVGPAAAGEPPGKSARESAGDEAPAEDQGPSQLAIPVPEEDGAPDAVVVSISAARRPQPAEPPSYSP